MEIAYSYKEIIVLKDNGAIILKLIYLWAFAEVGFGGFMHLLHIPLTGYIVGGFSVIINVLLAKYSNNNAAVFFKALGIVLAVKFLLSPYTPVGAYIAVCFQGLLAAFLFSVFGLNKFMVLLFSITVMIESAIQKPLFAMIIFGEYLWNSIIKLLVDTFSISKERINYTGVIVFIIYMMLYIIWGIILAKWANSLREHIENLSVDRNKIENLKRQAIAGQKQNNIRARFSFTKLAWVLIIVFLLLIPGVAVGFTLFYFIRILGLLIFLLVIVPALIKKHQSFLFDKNKEAVIAVSNALPLIKSNAMVAWRLSEQFNGLKKLKYFVTYTIWLNVFYE